MDYIVRATAADGQIRAFAATTRETVETARQDHNTSPVATAALGRLLTAGAMMGVMMKGDKDASDPAHPCRRTAERHYRNSRFQRKCKRLRRKPGRRDSGQQKRKT